MIFQELRGFSSEKRSGFIFWVILDIYTFLKSFGLLHNENIIYKFVLYMLIYLLLYDLPCFTKKITKHTNLITKYTIHDILTKSSIFGFSVDQRAFPRAAGRPSIRLIGENISESWIIGLVLSCPLKNPQDLSPFKHLWAVNDAVTSFCSLLNNIVLEYCCTSALA